VHCLVGTRFVPVCIGNQCLGVVGHDELGLSAGPNNVKGRPQGLYGARSNGFLLRITFPVSFLAGVQPTKETDHVRAVTGIDNPT
jgi:hypothetical protein